MSDPMSPAQEAAAMWGLAENLAYPTADRLACALQALEFYGKAYEDQGAAQDARESSPTGPLALLTTGVPGAPVDGDTLIHVWSPESGELATRKDGRWGIPTPLTAAP